METLSIANYEGKKVKDLPTNNMLGITRGFNCQENGDILNYDLNEWESFVPSLSISIVTKGKENSKYWEEFLREATEYEKMGGKFFIVRCNLRDFPEFKVKMHKEFYDLAIVEFGEIKSVIVDANDSGFGYGYILIVKENNEYRLLADFCNYEDILKFIW